MNDVLDRLAALRAPQLPVDADTVAADMRRGRRALHRRRAVRGGVLALAVSATLLSLLLPRCARRAAERV